LQLSVIAVAGPQDPSCERATDPRAPRAWVVLTAGSIAAACFVGYGMPRLWGLHATDEALRPSLETGIAAVAVVGASLLVARLRHARRLRDLLLLVALAAVALNNFIYNALPAYGNRTATYDGGVWMALTTLAAAAFVAAAFAADHRQVVLTRRTVVLGMIAAIAWVAFCEAIDLASGLVNERGPVGVYAPIWDATALICFGLLLGAAMRFALRGGSEDAVAKLLAGVGILLAGAELKTVAMPVVPGNWLMPSDGLRAGAFAMVVAVSAILYRRSVHELAHRARTAERTRIAHDLHDGLAQDLACIAAHSARLAREFGAEHPLTIAAGRALVASRGKIIDLEASGASTTAQALREVGAESAARYGVQISVEVNAPDQPEPNWAERSELVRIAREAIANAARHGDAQHIVVTLGSHGEQPLLRVTDDGSGLPAPGQPAAATGGTGLGMLAMRSRARRIGAQLHVNRRGAHGGAEIEVVRAAIGKGCGRA
jgi:signal transduction histidine kinase